ncbi:hypothetical protein LQ567_25810 [Niabella pedocola]|uniref:C2H2-type domain-containing protein n=1 Tax=Niabella pedocola TaxID=1752077 RepID=A0ABS8PYU1_9BACT|nr:hypothetical protein [Niabella pedocola]MCD2426228.1 hypothetical protein [Niabella pedocola]
MAKQIKAIKCPQCGSVKATELKPDFYRCNSCGTEFFLDNDDININHHYYRNTTPQPAVSPERVKKTALTVIFVFTGLMLLLMLPRMCSRHKNGYSAQTASGSKQQWTDAEVFYLEKPDGKPVYVIAGLRERNYNEKEHSLYIGFYDALTKKEIKLTELPLKVDRFDGKFKYFSNGTLYFIINSKKLFTIDRQLLTAAEVQPDTYKDLPDLQPGFAKIEYGYHLEDDFFKIVSNAGKELYYYPIISKTYEGYHEHVEAERAENLMPPNSPVITRFAFSSQNTDFKEEKIQLVKYQQQMTPGYPVERALFGWQKDYQVGSGIYVGDIPYKKTFIDRSWKKWARVQDYQDFTPGRLYFSPDVLGYNTRAVLISFKATPAEDEKESLQAMDAQNGKILWTVQTTESYAQDNALILKDGYFIKLGSKAVLYGADGKQVSEMNYRD